MFFSKGFTLAKNKKAKTSSEVSQTSSLPTNMELDDVNDDATVGAENKFRLLNTRIILKLTVTGKQQSRKSCHTHITDFLRTPYDQMNTLSFFHGTPTSTPPQSPNQLKYLRTSTFSRYIAPVLIQTQKTTNNQCTRHYSSNIWMI